MNIAFLHPGEMGCAMAVLARAAGHRVLWASTGRSAATRQRAEAAGFEDLGSIGALVAVAELIVSVCPPHGAQAVADEVAEAGFAGLYVDANAIAPQRARAIGQRLQARGARFVDAGLVGPPPVAGATVQTLLLLSGAARAEAAYALALAPLQVLDLGDDAGRASALKMCHSALHKGLLALQMSTWAAAAQAGLITELDQVLTAREVTAFHSRGRDEGLRRAGTKAWRFAGEMDEVAAFFGAATGAPGFGTSAGELFRRIAALPAPGPAEADAFWAALAAAGAGTLPHDG